MQTLTLGAPPVTLRLRRSARARRMTLRVSRLDGAVTLTLPTGVALAAGRAFAEDRLDWIRAQLAQVAPPRTLDQGVPFQGETLRLQPADLRAPRREGAVLLVPRGRPATARVWLREQARAVLAEASTRYAAQIGRGYTRLSLRDTRSRWGSCSSQGALMYNWRLVMAPPHVADYVAAHEVAHLRHMDHSPAFWAVVAGLRPDWKRSRGWLRDHGATLHRVDFGD